MTTPPTAHTTGVELLRRAGLTNPRYPWMTPATDTIEATIDYDLLHLHAPTLDLSEESIARIALSLIAGQRINLHSALT